ncbi:MAG: T9SS type A sorting domain-containing protein [Bacteroidetes bacterium]|nr:T9SS type A sorting domain-containing protein [Bacteroidota bacterium]
MFKNRYKLTLILFLFTISTHAQLTGMNPATGYAGQGYLTTNITSSSLFQASVTPSGNIYEAHLEQGSVVIPIMDYAGNNFSGCTYINSDTAEVSFSLRDTTTLGVYDLVITTTDINVWGTNLTVYTLPACFTVTPPDGFIQGKVYNDLNFNGTYDVGEPGIYGQNVGVNTGNGLVYTDSSGNYSIPVMNGNYTVRWYNNSMSNDNHYILNSDSATFNVILNGSNMTGYDFGGIPGLISMSPSTAYQGGTLNAIVVSRDQFVPGANPNGNVSYGLWRTSAGTYDIINNSAFTILDTNRVQLLYALPLTMPVGIYDLVVYASGQENVLQNVLTVTVAPSFLTGHVYYDANNNGQFDTGELPVANQKIFLTPDNYYAFTDANGDYRFGAALGTHTAAWTPSVGAYVVSSQPSYTFTNTGNQGGFDFGLRSALPDYTTNIYFNPAWMRCNQYSTSYITYTNRSNTVAQGTIHMIHSPNIIFGYVNPPRDSWNGDTTFWNFSNLQAMETRSISLTMLNPGAGSAFWYDTHIDVRDGLGVVQYSESSPRYAGIVRCSYDPNDKSVMPEGVDDVMHYTLLSDSLDYLIRFQNTGNDTAFIVMIRDTLDVSLDLTSFELIAESHLVEVQIDSNRAVTFTFNNILLPDSIVDEPNSHGYVRYRIHPMAGLPDPTRIENQAFIYFDLNPAVETNITWNTMVNQIPVGLDHGIEIDNVVRFHPNPMEKSGELVFENDKSDKMQLRIIDVSGKEVLNISTNASKYIVNRGNLASGLYLFQLINTRTGEAHSGKIAIR